MPNQRLQQLIDRPKFSHSKISNIRNLYVSHLLSVDTFRNVSKGSETEGVDKNLGAMFRAMSYYCHGDLEFEDQKSIPSHLAVSVKPKVCLTVDAFDATNTTVVVGSEAKGIDASLRVCYPQLIATCGSACIELHRLGLKREDCVVLGIAMAGEYCQFCAVYLIEDNFPVFVTLTPVLGLFDTLDVQYCIADWCLRMIAFGKETKRKLLTEVKASKGRNSSVFASVRVILNMNGYFAKPIHKVWKTLGDNDDEDLMTLTYSKRNIRLNYIMRIYESLRSKPTDQSTSARSGSTSILFPLGVVSVPGDKDRHGSKVKHNTELRKLLIAHCHRNGFTDMDLNYCPIVLFPLLPVSQGWCNDRPPTTTLRESYLKQLRIACNWLNEKRVAHLDLRPANIMWRSIVREQESSSSLQLSSEQVQLYIIDFEDAVMFDDGIPMGFVETVLRTKDTRYPFRSGDEKRERGLVAQAYHNEFFYEAIDHWIHSDSDLSFSEFMNSQQHCAIMNKVYPSGSRSTEEDNEVQEKHKKNRKKHKKHKK